MPDKRDDSSTPPRRPSLPQRRSSASSTPRPQPAAQPTEPAQQPDPASADTAPASMRGFLKLPRPAKAKRPQPQAQQATTRPSERRGAGAAASADGQRSSGRVSTKGHLQVSWMFLTLVGLVLIGAFTLSPTVSLLLAQRAEIAEVRSDIDETNASIAELQREVGSWSDPSYVRAQARERLFYVMPGEQAFTVIDDRDGPVEVDDTTVAATELVSQDVDWATVGLRSVIMAGVTELTPEQLLNSTVMVEE